MAGLLDFEDLLLTQDGMNLRPAQGAGLLAGAPPAGGSGVMDWIKSPTGQGLLAAALGAAATAGRRGAGPLNTIGMGGMAGLSAFSQAQDNQLRQAEAVEARKVRELQMQRGSLEVDALRRAAGDDETARRVMRETMGPQAAGLSSSVNAALPTDFRLPAPAVPASAPGGAAPGSRAEGWLRYKSIADRMAAEGLAAQAQKYYELADKFRPKYNTTPQVVRDPRTGDLVNLLVGEDGVTQVLPFGVKPDISMQDLGGRVVALDKNGLQGGQAWDKTMTPDARASNALGWANHATSKERLAYERSKEGQPQFHDGAWYTRPNAQNPTGAVMRPPMPEGMDPKLTEVQGNATQFATRMADATRTLDGLSADGNAPWPSTVARAGYKPEFPNWLPGGQVVGAGISALNKAATPEAALQVRQAQDNWITANLRKESGAAIPIPELEAERNKWFPQPGEGEETAKQKAAARKVAEEAMLVQAGPGKSQVRRILDQTAPKKGAQAVAKAVPLTSTKAGDLKHDQVYELPNGARGKWDSMKKRFQVVE